MIVPDLIKAVESGWEKSRLEGLKIQGKHRMNKRIRQLAIEAKLIASEPNGFDQNNLSKAQQKFAELIIRECADWIDRQDETRCPYGVDLVEHFGVEK